MEGAREFQISVKYQIYCLFCFRSSLKFKPCCRIWQQIQMNKLKVDGKAFFCEGYFFFSIVILFALF